MNHRRAVGPIILLSTIPCLMSLACVSVGDRARDSGAHPSSQPSSGPVRVWTQTGPEVAGLSAFDEVMASYMKDRNIPAGSLAVLRHGRLVLARGYRWAPEGKPPVPPTAMFRIASISKPITAVGMLQLVEQGKLRLDQPIGELLDVSRWKDKRIAQVTVRHLLTHRGGWDRDKAFDPMFRDQIIAKALGRPLPTVPQMVIDYMATQPLQFDPGTQYAYSNFGYCILGRIIEKVTGLTYEDCIRERVLAPVGAGGMRVGHSLPAQRFPGEVEYVDPSNSQEDSVMGADPPAKVPETYGGFNLHTMDAHGGWIASAVDLARFSAALDPKGKRPLLSAASLEEMWKRPPGVPDSDQRFYALGWSVRIVGAGRMNTWHNGSLPGTFTVLVRRWDGLSWVALFNQRSEGKSMPSSEAIDGLLHEAADRVTQWPDHDLFGRF
ncbi:MAG: beta-lactamase family protein [Phycisphaerae bacterium]|nr:beta-lactamase family protein [Phycisphaerae bacterium]